jgi:pimeloyl-ACP methyl ester carboxylesterase
VGEASAVRRCAQEKGMDDMKRAVAVNGVDLVVEESGRGERALVLVHGFTGSREDFRDHFDALAELGRTVIYDHRGHGESSNTGDAASYTFEQLVDDLRALLDALGIERCDLLGHSMGGMVALRFALAHPQRLASLLLMDTAARCPDGALRAPMAAAGRIARDDGMANLASLLRGRAAIDPQRPQASRRFEEEIGSEVYWARHRVRMTAMDPEAFAALGLLLVDQQPLTERLAEIGCPTLIIVGEEDRPFLAPSRELASGIAGAELVTIPAAAHSPQLENPIAWRRAVVGYLQRLRCG